MPNLNLFMDTIELETKLLGMGLQKKLLTWIVSIKDYNAYREVSLRGGGSFATSA